VGRRIKSDGYRRCVPLEVRVHVKGTQEGHRMIAWVALVIAILNIVVWLDFCVTIARLDARVELLEKDIVERVTAALEKARAGE